jgi:hypothetical protein
LTTSSRAATKSFTFATYAFQSRYVVGPLPPRDARIAIIHSGKGAKPKDRPIELLGREKVQELTARRIRAWHKLLSDEVSIYCANRAMQLLKAALALAAEDHEFRPPAMPTGLHRQRDKARKAVLTPEGVATCYLYPPVGALRCSGCRLPSRAPPTRRKRHFAFWTV